jgi:hypothetical protein
VDLGDFEAMDVLSEWFLRRSLLVTRRNGSERVGSIQDEGCPILLGTVRSSRFIEPLLNSEEGKHFRYRQHEDLNGFIKIRGAETQERAATSKFAVREDAGDEMVVGHGATLSAVRDRLALVHRMRIPDAKGTMTMLSCDSTFAIRQVAPALTDEEQAANIMKKTGWNERTMPPSFEMLFRVKAAPMNIEHDAGLAELLAWREYRDS